MRGKTVFVCQACGHQAPRWLGRCPDCGQWNSLREDHQAAPGATRRKGAGGTLGATSTPTPLPEIEMAGEARRRTGLTELDRVLGGGVVPGSVILIGGDPGIG
ncbi:MAG: DNA repair protein RadA, partial [Nitrospirales bacterium]